MYLRKTRIEEVEKVMDIIQAATHFLAEQGLPQWQDGHGPTQEMILADIENGESFVLVKEEQIVGTAALVSGIDPVYTAIYDGTWEEVTSAYLSIHRVAIDPEVKGKGLGVSLLKHLVTITALQGVKDLRIDTYPTNEPMKKTILKAGFTYRGMVKFPFPNGERKAYQLVI